MMELKEPESETNKSVCSELIKEHLPALLGEFSSTSRDLGDILISASDISGDMNAVCRVKVSSAGREVGGVCSNASTIKKHLEQIFTVVVKMAVKEIPYLKQDEVIPLDTSKMWYEYKVLRTLADLYPGSVPKTFVLDKQRNAIIMEDLVGYRQLSEVVASSEFASYLQVLEKAAKFIGSLHSSTCLANMAGKERQGFADDYNNYRMRQLMSDLLFDRPLNAEDKTNNCHPELLPLANAMRSNYNIVDKVRKIQQDFLTQNDCLCHGDFSADNILVTRGSFKVVDMEFSGVGLRAYDLALFLQMILLKLLGEYWRLRPENDPTRKEDERHRLHVKVGSQIPQEDRNESSLAGPGNFESSERLIGQTLECVLRGYSCGIGDCHQMSPQRPEFIDQVCSLVACEMMWTVFGSYVVEEFSGDVQAECLLLKIAEALLLEVDRNKTILWNICSPLQRIFGIQLLYQ